MVLNVGRRDHLFLGDEFSLLSDFRRLRPYTKSGPGFVNKGWYIAKRPGPDNRHLLGQTNTDQNWPFIVRLVVDGQGDDNGHFLIG
jgi:hypothetical protein